MAQPAIRVEGLCKEYVVGALPNKQGTFYEMLSHSLSGFWRKRSAAVEDAAVRDSFLALDDVNFATMPGEVVGVVGRNGAGKSTLLKILSRISAPSRGSVTLRGRLASLLEVGTGFHPELSGRENIFLNATILGMSKREVARKFDEIVAFAEVERFLDMPVKRYSSGMYVRLAFAVAAHVEADILLVDEVLAVGDAEFQKRCLGKMEDVAKAGRTVLFVSHNLTALRNFCSTGLLLEKGRAVYSGGIVETLNQYAVGRGRSEHHAVDLAHIDANADASLLRVAVVPVDSSAGSRLGVSSGFRISARVLVRRPASDIGVFLHCHDESLARVFSSGSFFEASLNGSLLPPGTYEFECEVPGDLLNCGEYSLDAMLVQDRNRVISSESSVLCFRIDDESLGIEGWHWPVVGTIRPKLRWTRRQTGSDGAFANDQSQIRS